MKKIVAAALLSTASVSAMATDQGGYLTANVGSTIYSNASSQIISSVSFINPYTIGIGGGYHLNPYLSLEGGYSHMNESTITTTYITFPRTATEKLKASSLRIAVVGSLPIGEKFELLGFLGAANTQIDYTASLTGTGFPADVVQSASARKTNLMYGLGAQLNFNKRISLRAQYLDLGKVQLPGNFSGGVAAPNIGVKIVTMGAVFNF